jgi:hypothetical protein
VPLREEKARRLVKAVLANIDNWTLRIEEIEAHANVGNKARALSLLRDMEMAKISLNRMAGLDDEP